LEAVQIAENGYGAVASMRKDAVGA
jgi:hypothetical protein